MQQLIKNSGLTFDLSSWTVTGTGGPESLHKPGMPEYWEVKATCHRTYGDENGRAVNYTGGRDVATRLPLKALVKHATIQLFIRHVPRLLMQIANLSYACGDAGDSSMMRFVGRMGSIDTGLGGYALNITIG